jgi:ABC-type multidrug transport system ATPase subunit
METMHKDFRGECIYQAEVDVHFPQLTVGQTLQFAAEGTSPSSGPIPSVSLTYVAQRGLQATEFQASPASNMRRICETSSWPRSA